MRRGSGIYTIHKVDSTSSFGTDNQGLDYNNDEGSAPPEYGNAKGIRMQSIGELNGHDEVGESKGDVHDGHHQGVDMTADVYAAPVDDVEAVGGVGGVNDVGGVMSSKKMAELQKAEFKKRDDIVDASHKLDPTRTNSNFESLMNILKANVGTGILALPVAFKYGGLWVSFVGIFVLGIIATHCIHQLVKSGRHLAARVGRHDLDYGDIVHVCFKSGTPKLRKFAPASKIIINLFLVVTQLGFCTVYILFVSSNYQQVIEYYLPNTQLSQKMYMLIVYAFLIPYCAVRNLRILAYCSMAANVLEVFGLVVALQFCFRDLPAVSDVPAFGGWSSLPLYFGIAMFAFEGIGCIMPIENKMRTPKDLLGYVGIINLGMTIVAVLYAGMGFYGYVRLGVDATGSITLSLPYDWYYNAVRIGYATAIFISYNLQFYVPIDILWPLMCKKFEAHTPVQYEKWIKRWGEYILRFLLVSLTVILATSIPELGLMISLVGSLASSAVALIFPPLIQIVTFYPDNLVTKWMVFKNVIIMIIGFIGFGTGSVTTIIEIIQTFQ